MEVLSAPCFSLDVSVGVRLGELEAASTHRKLVVKGKRTQYSLDYLNQHVWGAFFLRSYSGKGPFGREQPFTVTQSPEK